LGRYCLESKRSVKRTFRASAIFVSDSNLGFASPRSISLIKAWRRSAASARSSCDSSAKYRSRRTFSPNIRALRARVAGAFLPGRPIGDQLSDCGTSTLVCDSRAVVQLRHWRKRGQITGTRGCRSSAPSDLGREPINAPGGDGSLESAMYQ